MNLECARDVKESLAKAADSTLLEADPRYFSIPVTPYELPDGTLIEVNIERFQMAEILFDPSPMVNNPALDLKALYAHNSISGQHSGVSSLVGSGSMESVPKVVCDSILRSEVDIQSMLLSNMMLTGGCACIDGVSERLKSEGKHNFHMIIFTFYTALHLVTFGQLSV